MGQSKGFLEYQRQVGGYRDIEERLKDYKEVFKQLGSEEIKNQSARCMDCGTPFCHSLGCPLGNLIPEFNDAVYNGQWKEAWERLEKTNNFPEITGRICPALCEASCTLSFNDSPVTIREIELAISEYAYQNDWYEPKAPEVELGKSVAVVGSGPSGMAAAQQLRRSGFAVTLFEKSNKIGGLMRYGIPDFKLAKDVIERRVKQMAGEGVKFETGVKVGEDLSVGYLKNKFDAVVLTMGAGEPRDLPVPGRELKGVDFAMDFLSRNTDKVNGVDVPDFINVKDKVVLVIGGGDTGSDCVGTSNRQGAKKVYQFEIMPKPQEWTDANNPNWPNWPNILRTSSSHYEGAERDWNIATKRFTGKDGVLTGADFVRVEWKADENGAFKMHELPGTEFSLAVDQVFLSMGFVHVEHGQAVKNPGLELDPRGNIAVKNFMTSVPGIFAAGDAVSGASLVVRAIDQGRRLAQEVTKYLLGK
ncbi:MAG: glutamate synthase subunit beta [Spirochaetales bacterium]|nr:glutamate synthase subunit beta [Spirochaetales bacterium]